MGFFLYISEHITGQSYIGLKEEKTGFWNWMDGTKLTFTNWKPKEPTLKEPFAEVRIIFYIDYFKKLISIVNFDPNVFSISYKNV